MKIRHALLFAGVVATATTAAAFPRSAEQRPLFSAVKAFCIDTGAEARDVEVALEHAGGRLIWRSQAQRYAADWDVVVGGHAMTVRSQQVDGLAICTVWSTANEDTSIAELRDWADVPEAAPDVYHFVDKHGTHHPMPSKPIPVGGWRHGMMGVDGSVRLTLVPGAFSASVELRRSLPSSAPPALCKPPSVVDITTATCSCPSGANCASLCQGDHLFAVEETGFSASKFCVPHCIQGERNDDGSCRCLPPKAIDSATGICAEAR